MIVAPLLAPWVVSYAVSENVVDAELAPVSANACFTDFLIMYSSSIHSKIGTGVTFDFIPKREKMGVTFGL